MVEGLITGLMDILFSSLTLLSTLTVTDGILRRLRVFDNESMEDCSKTGESSIFDSDTEEFVRECLPPMERGGSAELDIVSENNPLTVCSDICP